MQTLFVGYTRRRDKPRTYSTSRIASAVGVHPNTVYLYERIGFITAPARSPNGYRVFTELHLLQVQLVRAALNVELVQNGLRREVLAIVDAMARQSYDEAIALAEQRIGHLRRDVWNLLDEMRQQGMTIVLTSNFMDKMEAPRCARRSPCASSSGE